MLPAACLSCSNLALKLKKITTSWEVTGSYFQLSLQYLSFLVIHFFCKLGINCLTERFGYLTKAASSSFGKLLKIFFLPGDLRIFHVRLFSCSHGSFIEIYGGQEMSFLFGTRFYFSNSAFDRNSVTKETIICERVFV